MEKLIPLISDIQEIIRKSDLNLEISLPIIAVVGSQSTGTFIFTQAKVPYQKALLANSFYQKEKEQSLVGPLKYSSAKSKKTGNMLSSLKGKENILKIWINSENSLNYRPKRSAEQIKESVIYRSGFDSIRKMCQICSLSTCQALSK